MPRKEYQQIRRLRATESLDRFITTNVQATSDYLKLSQRVIDDVVRTLQKDVFSYDVTEVFKTGSLGQGTALKAHLSDIDLVVYLNDITVEEITHNVTKILAHMDEALRRANLSGYECLSIDEFRLGIQLRVGEEIFEIDLLPGIKVPGIGTNSDLIAMYKKMHKESKSVQKHYSVSFAKQQRDFISTRETKLKNLFQLLKYWSKVDLKAFGCEKVPSYLMCLIVIHTWEECGSPEEFETKIGFKAVLKTLLNYRKIQKVWYEYYDEETRRIFGELEQPYLIDPANPSLNMLDGWNWEAIIRAAQSTRESPILKNVVVTSDWC